MRPTNFAPAHSRRLAFAIATYLLIAIFTSSVDSRIFASAAEVPVVSPADAITPSVLPVVPGAVAHFSDEHGDSDGVGGYAPDFQYFDRSLLGRQDAQQPQAVELKNNQKTDMEIGPEKKTYFVFKRGQPRVIRSANDVLEALEARGDGNGSGDSDEGNGLAGGTAKTGNNGDVDDSIQTRQAGNRVWISANTCRQPLPQGNTPPKSHPKLVMRVLTSSDDQAPLQEFADDLAAPPILFDEGLASVDVNTTSDIYIEVSAPTLEKDWTGSWSFELAASVDGPYHSYNASTPFLYMIDTDSESAVFITFNISEPNSTDTDKWKDNNPFSMYAFEVGDQSAITGLEHSLCALKDIFGNGTLNTTTAITTKFGADMPKSLFNIQNLKNGTKYNAFLTVEGGEEDLRLPGGRMVRAGGMVFQNFTWTTKSDDSCQVLYDLDFCDSVAYAVPSSPEFKLDDDRLKALYDNQARGYYTNFTRSLAQVACNTSSDAQYSLARTCKDCERDYKNWLCSVLIPRCEDWTAMDPWLQERNVNARLSDGSATFGGNDSVEIEQEKRDRFAFSKSRNPMIDKDIKPGPYKEMKPCDDLCFDIVRSCPAQLGFACPNQPARGLTYGTRNPDKLQCNFPGAVVELNVQGAAGTVAVRGMVAAVVAMMVVAVLGWM